MIYTIILYTVILFISVIPSALDDREKVWMAVQLMVAHLVANNSENIATSPSKSLTY
jgi:hypothetical protein